MSHYLAVFIGGGLGCACRFALGRFLWAIAPSFPLGTLAANILSCMVMAIALTRIEPGGNSIWVYIIIVGFCGGFSTFSTFSYETVMLFKTGSLWAAVLNILISLVFCTLILTLTAKYWK